MTDNRIDTPELAGLLAIAAAADTRFPGLQGTQDPRLAAWQEILGDTLLEDAHQAVMRIVRRPQLQVMQPGHVLDEVKLIRKERLRAIGEDALVPPDGLEPGRYPAWLREARRHIADGRDLSYAIEQADAAEGASRRVLGPSTKHTIGELMQGRGTA